MIPLKSNFKNLHDNMKCLTCDDDSSFEDENHILNCENLKTEESETIKFEDVFGTIDVQLNAVKIFIDIIRRRETFLDLN